LYTLASRQWIAAFDYVSEIPRPASRALCRLSTGADHDFHDCGDRLDPMCQDLRRPVLITATPELTLRPVLAARAFAIRATFEPAGPHAKADTP
jgi:hypothetical protein